MTPPISSPSRARFQRFLTEYLDANQRNASDLIIRKAGSCSYEFFKATVAVAPTKEDIKQAVIGRGWKVKRKPGAWTLRPGEKRGSQGPLHRMQAAQIGRRTKAIGAAACGFLPAVRKLGAKNTGGKVRIVPIKNPRGRVDIAFNAHGDTTVTVVNSMPGIAKIEQQHHILRTGFNEGSKDIIKYLRAKESGGSGKTVGGNGR